MSSSTRAAAVTQASVHANKLTSAPISMTNPSTGTPPTSDKTRIGAGLVPKSWPAIRKPRTSAYAQSVNIAPTRMALRITARGIVFNGFRASLPSVVALSNPTKLNSARTRPSRTPPPVTPVKCA